MTSVVILVLVLAIAGWIASAYNSLVSLRNQVANAWRQIDVQLKRRHDLIPNLVEAVKGYMQFERETLTQVVEARAKAVSAPDQGSRMAAETQLTTGLGKLLAVMENYPQLKADENVTQAPGRADYHRKSDRVRTPGLQRRRAGAQHAGRNFSLQPDRQQFRFSCRRVLQGRARGSGGPESQSLDEYPERTRRFGRAARLSSQARGITDRHDVAGGN